MLQIENEYETPIELNYNQNNHDNFKNSDNFQEIIDYTEQELKGTSSTNNIYQNASNNYPKKYNYPKKNFGQYHFF